MPSALGCIKEGHDTKTVQRVVPQVGDCGLHRQQQGKTPCLQQAGATQTPLIQCLASMPCP